MTRHSWVRNLWIGFLSWWLDLCSQDLLLVILSNISLFNCYTYHVKLLTFDKVEPSQPLWHCQYGGRLKRLQLKGFERLLRASSVQRSDCFEHSCRSQSHLIPGELSYGKGGDAHWKIWIIPSIWAWLVYFTCISLPEDTTKSEIGLSTRKCPKQGAHARETGRNRT